MKVSDLGHVPVRAGQNANAGMLPPSDSEDETDDEPAPAKGKSAQVKASSCCCQFSSICLGTYNKSTPCM